MFSPNPKRMDQRSTLEVVLVFIAAPIPIGIAILTFARDHAIANGHQFTISEWFFQVVWFGLLGLGLLFALPATGLQELDNRRRKRNQERVDGEAAPPRAPIVEPCHFGPVTAASAPGGVPRFPRYAHCLAKAYYLSLVLGPVGFLAFTGVAGFLCWRRGFAVDGWVLGMISAALACPMFCWAFRRWFERWGRRHWPADESVDQPDGGL